MIAAACLAVPASHAAPAPDAEEAWARISALRASTSPFDGSRLLWQSVDQFPGHLAIQAAYADEAVIDGFYESTLERYRSRYEQDPTPENAYLFARIDYDRVRARATTARALRAGSQLPGLLWLKTTHRAEDLAAAGKHEAALALIDASAGAAAMDAMGARKARISLLLGMGRLDEAHAAAEEAWKADWTDPGVHSLRIGVAYLRGNLGDLSSLIELAPGSTDYAYALLAQAAYFSMTGKKAKARERWKRILESPRDFYDWEEARMEAMSSLGDLEGAGKQAMAVLALDPGNMAAQVQLASYALGTRNIPEGEKMARATLAKNPRSLSAIGLVGSIEFQHGRYRDALLLNDRALALAPGITSFWVSRAATFSHMGSRERQRESMARAAKINPSEPYYLREMGRLHMDAGEYDQGLEHYKALIAQDEPGIEEFRGYGRCSVGADRIEQGVAAFERALELVQTPEEKKIVKDDIAWAKGHLRAALERYPRDAAATVEKIPVKSYLDASPVAAYLEHRRLVIGIPWAVPLARWDTEGAASRQTVWAPGGNGVYALVDNRIDFLDLESGATHTVLAELPTQTAYSDEFPASRGITSFALSPNGKHMAVLAQEMKRGRAESAVLLDYTAQEKDPREVYRRGQMVAMKSDPVTGRVLILGGGNLRVDLIAGTTEEFPLVGCTLADLDFSPGGERMACVAVDANGPEADEIILYDFATRRKVPLEIAGRGPSWSPDGQFLAYVWRGRQLRVLELKTGSVTAYEIGHELDHLLPFPAEGGKGTRWSSDGRFVHCLLGPAKGKRRGRWGHYSGEATVVIVDRRNKTAWTRAGPFDSFEWAPARKP